MISKSLLINSDPNIENQSVLHINRLDARATVVPAERRGVYYRNKYESSLSRSLNGDFRFRYLLGDTERFVKNADGEPWEGETLFVATASPLADAHHADASVFLEKDGYTVYRVVPAREEYTLMLKS